MPLKNAFKKIGFVDEDEGFIKILAKAIGCYYSRANERTYNLNKFDSEIQSEMGVFAWVHKESDDSFWISTRKIWVEEARAKVLAGRKAMGINCFSRDTQRAGDSISLDTKEGYQKTVSVLTMVKKLR
jgi:hypothetical protein